MKQCAKCKESIVRGELCVACQTLKMRKFGDLCLGGCGKQLAPWYMRCGACGSSGRMDPAKVLQQRAGRKKGRR